MAVEQPPSPLAVAIGHSSRLTHRAFQTTFLASFDRAAYLEIRIEPRPRFGNLAAAIRFHRRIRYGPRYTLHDTRRVALLGREWLRSHFEHSTAPARKDTDAIEYALAQGNRLYSVTVHGSSREARRGLDIIETTLALANSAPGERFPELPPPSISDSTTLAAAESVVMIVAADIVDGRVESASGGSGVVVSADGRILTNAHILHDEHEQRLHDLFALARRTNTSGVEFLCAGTAARRDLDLVLDLAVLTCTMDMDGNAWMPSKWPAITLGTATNIQPGAPVSILGFPDEAGGRLHLTTGEITGWTTRDAHRLLMTDAKVAPGTSGGAAIDRNGELIGIPTAFRFRAYPPEQSLELGVAHQDRIAFERIGLVCPIDDVHTLLTPPGVGSPAPILQGEPHSPR